MVFKFRGDLIDSVILNDKYIFIGSFHIVILAGIALKFKGIIEFIDNGLIFIDLLFKELPVGLKFIYLLVQLVMYKPGIAVKKEHPESKDQQDKNIPVA